jgi:ABC-type antimicrobial peptide transport system permease subunit
VIAQVFIIATIIVSKQISYSLNKNMGFKKDAIVYFNTNYRDTSKTNKKVLLEKLKAIPEIAAISLSDPPASNGYSSSTLKYKDGEKEIETDVLIKRADTNYINLYKIKLLAGKNLPAGDTVHDLLINETYSKLLGFQQPQQAIGKYLEWNKKQDVITGVVADFNTASIHSPIKPLLIETESARQHTFNIALQPQNAEGTVWKNAMAKIKKSFKEIYPENDLEIKFLDETIAKYYTAEQHISSLLKWATGLAIFISCLGLLGLVMYTTNQRTKEIGIRKVIGARVSQIILLLSKDFIKLVMIAFIIAVPIVWFAANKWLENFAYKTNLSVWIFLIGGAIMLLMAMFVLLLRTYKAAAANPVESLRSE